MFYSSYLSTRQENDGNAIEWTTMDSYERQFQMDEFVAAQAIWIFYFVTLIFVLLFIKDCVKVFISHYTFQLLVESHGDERENIQLSAT